jgi:polysaccharide biosynthesis/export protein
MIRFQFLLKIIFLFAIISLQFSCVPRKQFVYFCKEDTTMEALQKPYEPIIQASDKVRILVNSVDKETGGFFSFSANDNSSNSPGYLVNAAGYIDIPLIGPFHIAGLTTTQAKDSLKILLEKYINRPTVIVTLLTFKITILGYINGPGIYESDHERLTILEAIAKAGDIKPDGKRVNIMVIREKGNGREYGFVDITSKSIITSPYYNLHANDIIYIEPTFRSRLVALQPYYAVLGMVVGIATLFFVIANYQK